MTTHVFDTEDAAKYGILEAIILYNIRHWCAKNAANKKHFHDGHYWTYNSVQAWQELFPYASTGQIRRAIENLKEAGAIKTGNYNSSAYDRTTWYCVQIHLANSANGFDANSEPIPDVNTDINAIGPELRSDNAPKQKRACQLPDDFYPDDTSKAVAKELGVGKMELEKFKDYHRARGSVMKDWQAAFRTWARNSVKFGKA